MVKPKFDSSKIISDRSSKLETKRGTYHKSIMKKPRRIAKLEKIFVFTSFCKYY